MKYKVFPDRLKLIESHLVPKAKMGKELRSIRNLHPTCPVWGRSERSLLREWAAHNLAYAIGIRRGKTADCDLNYEPKWYENLIYGVVGTIALWMIK
jgi:hypothetical protein